MTDPWQPFETAPWNKVGQFLVYIPECRSGEIHVCKVSKTHNGFIRVIGGIFSWDRPKPTKWMPIPLPTEEAANDEGLLTAT